MSEQLQNQQTAFLLLQLLGGDEPQVMKSELNKDAVRAGKALDLSPKQANSLRDQLVPHYVEKSRGRTPKGGTADFYTLTDRGKAYLLELEQYPGRLPVNGRAINRLLQVVRDLTHDEFGATSDDAATELQTTHPTSQPRSQPTPQSTPKQAPQPTSQPAASATPQSANQTDDRPDAVEAHVQTTEPAATIAFESIRAGILQALGELHSGPYHHRDYVPIHAIRTLIEERFGAQTASHAVFDDEMHALRRDGQVRLIAITDSSTANTRELEAAIPGVHETLFYAERLGQ